MAAVISYILLELTDGVWGDGGGVGGGVLVFMNDG